MLGRNPWLIYHNFYYPAHLCQVVTVVTITVLALEFFLVPLGVGEVVELFPVGGAVKHPVRLSVLAPELLPATKTSTINES